MLRLLIDVSRTTLCNMHSTNLLLTAGVMPIRWQSDTFEGEVMDPSLLRTADGNKWKAQYKDRCFNGDTGKHDLGRPMQTHEFLVYFAADGEYWRMHVHRHRKLFKISTRAAPAETNQSNGSNVSCSDDCGRGRDGDNHDDDNHDDDNHDDDNHDGNEGDDDVDDDDDPIMICRNRSSQHQSPASNALSSRRKRGVQNSAAPLERPAQRQRPLRGAAELTSAHQKPSTCLSHTSSSDDDSALALHQATSIKQGVSGRGAKAKMAKRHQPVTGLVRSAAAQRSGQCDSDTAVNVSSVSVEAIICKELPHYQGTKQLATRKVLTKLQQQGSINIDQHTIEKAVHGLCFYNQSKKKWLLRRDALAFLSKQQQKDARSRKEIDYSAPASGYTAPAPTPFAAEPCMRDNTQVAVASIQVDIDQRRANRQASREHLFLVLVAVIAVHRLPWYLGVPVMYMCCRCMM